LTNPIGQVVLKKPSLRLSEGRGERLALEQLYPVQLAQLITVTLLLLLLWGRNLLLLLMLLLYLLLLLLLYRLLPSLLLHFFNMFL
jgi:hypothetical protein